MIKPEVNLNSILQKLTSLTKSRFIILTESGDQAIMLAVESVQKLSQKKEFLAPEQGGWFSYLKYPKKIGFDVVKIKTELGIINLDDLKKKIPNAVGLIYSNPAGYFAEQPSKKIYGVCKNT